MSKISDAFDDLHTVIPTLAGFTTKTEIPDPYNLGSNANHYFKDGWGLRFDSAPTIESEFKKLTEEYGFELILVRKVQGNRSDESQLIDQTKSLFDDAVTFKKHIVSNYTGGGNSITVPEADINTNMEYDISSETERRLIMTVAFTLQTREVL